MQSVAQFPKVFQLENVPVAFKIFPYYCHVRKETSLGYGKCRSLYVWYKPKYREQDVEWKSKLHISLKEIIIVHVVFIILPFILRVMITADHVQLTQKTSLHQKGCIGFFFGIGSWIFKSRQELKNLACEMFIQNKTDSLISMCSDGEALKDFKSFSCVRHWWTHSHSHKQSLWNEHFYVVPNRWLS